GRTPAAQQALLDARRGRATRAEQHLRIPPAVGVQSLDQSRDHRRYRRRAVASLAWEAEGPRHRALDPSRPVGNGCQQRRREADQQGFRLEAEMFKQMGNSLYGKVAQGLSDNKVFNTKINRREYVEPSAITNPFIAAYITGMVR